MVGVDSGLLIVAAAMKIKSERTEHTNKMAGNLSFCISAITMSPFSTLSIFSILWSFSTRVSDELDSFLTSLLDLEFSSFFDSELDESLLDLPFRAEAGPWPPEGESE